MNEEPGELVFLRYAIAVVNYCNGKKLNPGEISELEETLKTGKSVSIDQMRELFPNAVINLNSWFPEDVRDYWLKDHNEITKDNLICQTYLGKVEKILPPKENEMNRIVVEPSFGNLKSYIPLKKGDLVSMHALTIAEKITPDIYKKYFK